LSNWRGRRGGVEEATKGVAGVSSAGEKLSVATAAAAEQTPTPGVPCFPPVKKIPFFVKNYPL